MEYFAGLDVSMEETHVCVVDRDGKIILEARTPTAPKTSLAFDEGSVWAAASEHDPQACLGFEVINWIGFDDWHAPFERELHFVG